jgi:ATP-binding cassette subfamily F protein uup
VGEYIGGYSDWKRQAQRSKLSDDSADAGGESQSTRAPARAEPPAEKKKLSYKLARELEQLPGRVEALEREIETLGQAMNDPAFFKQSPEVIAEKTTRAQHLQSELDAAYRRWEELES